MVHLLLQRRAYGVIKVESVAIEGKDKARRNKPHVFTVTGSMRGIEHIIGEEGSPKTLFSDINNEYKIPKREVNDKQVIKAR